MVLFFCVWCYFLWLMHILLCRFFLTIQTGDSFLYKAMNVNRPKHAEYYQRCMSGELPEVLPLQYSSFDSFVLKFFSFRLPSKSTGCSLLIIPTPNPNEKQKSLAKLHKLLLHKKKKKKKDQEIRKNELRAKR